MKKQALFVGSGGKARLVKSFLNNRKVHKSYCCSETLRGVIFLIYHDEEHSQMILFVNLAKIRSHTTEMSEI